MITKQKIIENLKNKKFPIKRVVAGVAAIAVFGGGYFVWQNIANSNKIADIQYTEEEVVLNSITNSITGSAAVEAANSYTVTSLVEEEILSANFEEGDIVEKDMILYELDSSDAQSSIQTNQISLSASQRSLENAISDLSDLSVTSPINGYVVEWDIEVGDKVNANQVLGTVRDSSDMTITIPFSSDDALTFYVGQSADVILDGSYETLSGTVKEISAADIVGIGNTIQRNVTITVQNPGGITNTQTATASINSIGSASSGTFDYSEERTITSEVSGTVSSINVSEGGKASTGQVLISLSSDTLQDSVLTQQENVQKSEIQVENAQKSLESYTITSPISGTVVEKNFKEGETTEQGQTLCVIYDLSYLTMTLNIDELDVQDLSVGQEVTVTAEAVEGTFKGVVTKVSVVGTTSDGVTTYPVTIEIEATDNLLPGMNADAEIVLESAKDVLTVPIQAVQRGNTILVTEDSPSAVNAVENSDAPEGYVYVQVETGVSDDSNIEIVSGLSEGDKIAYASVVANTSSDMEMMPGMTTGGMPSGGDMPSGNMPSGEMPSGGGMGAGRN